MKLLLIFVIFAVLATMAFAGALPAANPLTAGVMVPGCNGDCGLGCGCAGGTCTC